MKKCKGCEIEKPLSEFRESRPGYFRPYCKECTLKKKKEYRDKKIEEYRETDRERYSRNHDDILDKNRKWRDENKDRVDASRKKYVNSHPDRVLNSKRKWFLDNIELARKLISMWAGEHPEKVSEKNRNRRARVKNSIGKITSEEWEELLEFYDHKCLRCGSSEDIQLDHVVPLVKGGTNTIDNAQPLCLKCNAWKGSKTIDFRK